VTGKQQVMDDTGTPSAASDLPLPRVPDVIFTNWREALHLAGLSAWVGAIRPPTEKEVICSCGARSIRESLPSRRDCHRETTLSLKAITARIGLGSSKSANATLQGWMTRQGGNTPAGIPNVGIQQEEPTGGPHRTKG